MNDNRNEMNQMDSTTSSVLPHGIIPVVQTPFSPEGSIDWTSLGRLVDDAIEAGAAGLLAPVVASEVAYLTVPERKAILRFLATHIQGRVPLIVGASSDDPEICRDMVQVADEINATAWLVAVPQSHYQALDRVVPFFRDVTRESSLPLIIQDLQFGGPGLPIPLISELREQIACFQGIKIETVPSGPKYSAIREALDPDFHIAGGWAIPQMIEALDRGVDAMIPESSMVRVYYAIQRLYELGKRDEALKWFRRLLPVLVFTNQELAISIAFFKRLLVRKGLFATDKLRIPGFIWDAYNQRIADELIELYLDLDSQIQKQLRFEETI